MGGRHSRAISNESNMYGASSTRGELLALLPQEMLEKVIKSGLDASDVAAMRLVCKTWATLMSSDGIWRTLCIKEWPHLRPLLRLGILDPQFQNRGGWKHCWNCLKHGCGMLQNGNLKDGFQYLQDFRLVKSGTFAFMTNRISYLLQLSLCILLLTILILQ